MQGKLLVLEACKHSMQGAEEEDELTLTSLLIDQYKVQKPSPKFHTSS